MGNKSLKKRVSGLAFQIDDHEEKIRLELLKDEPNFGRINHWRTEIRAFTGKRNIALRRLRK